MVETVTERESKRAGEREKQILKPVSLASITAKSTSRISTKISELDRVLGGGLVQGQVVLLAGEPGIGKSTILLQVANELSAVSRQTSVLYVSGEESVSQIAIRGQRLDIRNKNIQFLEETDIDLVIQLISNQLSDVSSPTAQAGKKKSVSDKLHPVNSTSFLIIDSIQTMYTSDLSGMAGSVGQVRECAYRLVRLAKSKNIPLFIVGHVTKQGGVAGPAVLMHVVDTVLWFEGDKSLTLRLLRAVKNRFGPTDEVGIFTMEDKGLISEDKPEKFFITLHDKNTPGSCITSVLQGTRPILVEIQTLISPTKTAFPKRIAQGIDSKRFELLLAVLIRRCGLPLYDYDCFVNVSGGISVKEPACDLAVCLSMASSYLNKPLPKGSLAIGEVGLLGDIREVTQGDRRVKEAKRLGYKTVISKKTSNTLQEGIRKYLR